jgi:hypothetical protein
MSMPGFVFYFHCDSCDATSGGYSVYVFPDIFSSHIVLPAWSIAHKCWCSLNADLDTDQRRAMESDRDLLLAFAASMSSDSLTVGVPQFYSNDSGGFDVNVTPDPKCPICGCTCQAIFGYPDREEVMTIAHISLAEFRIAPLSLIGLSVRSTKICRDLGLRTMGDIEDGRTRFAGHPSANENTLREIDTLLSRKPTGSV